MNQDTQTDDQQMAGADSGSNSPAPETLVLDAEHSISAREPERQSLADDVEQFLQGGGQIESVPKDFRADPPKKPENNYGRGSI